MSSVLLALGLLFAQPTDAAVEDAICDLADHFHRTYAALRQKTLPKCGLSRAECDGLVAKVQQEVNRLRQTNELEGQLDDACGTSIVQAKLNARTRLEGWLARERRK